MSPRRTTHLIRTGVRLLVLVLLTTIAGAALVKLAPPTANGAARTIKGDNSTTSARDRTMQSGQLSLLGPQPGRLEENG
jgi:hypothetical protein